MKLTKSHLKQLIKETIFEDDEYEEESEFTWPGDEDLTPEQERVVSLIGDLEEAITEMGESNPVMTDEYVRLMRSLRGAGLNLDALVRMS